MARYEPFDIEIGDGVIRSALRLPDGDAPFAAVLLVGGLPGSTSDHLSLLDEVTEAFASSAIASALFAPRSDDAASRDSAATLVDDACAVLRWLGAHHELDPGRLGVFGCGTGAVVAACAAGRFPAVNDVCLLGAATAADAGGRTGESNGKPPLFDLDKVTPPWLSSLGELDPIAALAAREGRTLLLHGAADRAVPPEVAQPYVDVLDHAGRAAEQELIPLADHALSTRELRAVCLERLCRFFSGMIAPAEVVQQA